MIILIIRLGLGNVETVAVSSAVARVIGTALSSGLIHRSYHRNDDEDSHDNIEDGDDHENSEDDDDHDNSLDDNTEDNDDHATSVDDND